MENLHAQALARLLSERRQIDRFVQSANTPEALAAFWKHRATLDAAIDTATIDICRRADVGGPVGVAA
jgi:hypothetical protein